MITKSKIKHVIMSGNKSVLSKVVGNKYVGGRKNQLRHGHGTYSYENKFFKYEGEWENGLKHGHGKMFLGQSGYYEGTFKNGEIEGHGYKVFGISGSSYTGQFLQGEMHGQGLMKKPSGEQHEGSWFQGKKQGDGILTGSDGSIYEGGFHQDLRHGEGLQIYNNGDQYEGDWVSGMRHGHGMIHCADGTLYDGQWRGDLYHGQGSIKHASGVHYKGMWINGKPQNPAVSLRLVDNEIVVEQGKTFDITFECVDEEGNVTALECGRKFKVTASIQKIIPSLSKSRSGLTTTSSRLASTTSRLAITPSQKTVDREELAPIPFAHSYELLQVPQPNTSLYSTPISTPPVVPESISSRTVTLESENQSEDNNSKDEALNNDNNIIPEDKHSEISPEKNDLIRTSSNSNLTLHSSSFVSQTKPKKRSGSMAVGRSLASQSLLLSAKVDDSSSFGSKEEEYLASLSEPEVTSTKGGKALFKELFLPPPPPPDISHIISSNKSLDVNQSKSTVKSSTSLSPSLVSSTSSSNKSANKKSSKSKEKLCQPRREKYCQPGKYVLIIREVTTPPFIDNCLEDFQVEVTVVSLKGPYKEISIDSLRSKTRERTNLSAKSKMNLVRE